MCVREICWSVNDEQVKSDCIAHALADRRRRFLNSRCGNFKQAVEGEACQIMEVVGRKSIGLAVMKKLAKTK